MIVLAVANTSTGTHHLDFARHNYGTRSHTIFVFERAFQDVGNDFHGAVTMSAKTLRRFDPIVVEDP